METLEKKGLNPAKPLPPLEEVLSYKKDAVIYKFMENYDVTFEMAEDLFNETKKWLWLCAKFKKEQLSAEKSDDSFNLFVDESMIMLDNMWHTFILFTQEYTSFCKTHFGMYLHHSPSTKEEKDAGAKLWKENKQQVITEVRARTERQYSYIYDALGEKMGAETLKKWYKTYARMYTKPNIHYLLKKV